MKNRSGLRRLTSLSAHERGVLTAREALQLVSDWQNAGEPEDIGKFLATTWPWCDMPVHVLLRTFEEASQTPIDKPSSV